MKTKPKRVDAPSYKYKADAEFARNGGVRRMQIGYLCRQYGLTESQAQNMAVFVWGDCR